MLRRVSLLVLLVLILTPGPGTARAASTTTNGCPVNDGFPSGISLEKTCAVLREYVTAYNRHDAHAALALLDPRVNLFDCDFVWNRVTRVFGKKEAAQWLRDRFAENDQFQGAIGVGGWTTDGASPLVFSLIGTRSNDALTGHGALSGNISGSKGILNASGTRIFGMTLGDDRICREPSFPPGPSIARTRTVLQVFIDAYNAHDIGRVVQLFGTNRRYIDCDYAHQKRVVLYRASDVRRWLTARFTDHDRVENTHIVVTSASPREAIIEYARTNGWLTAQGRAPYAPARFPSFVMNKAGDHIQSGGWDQCSDSALAWRRGVAESRRTGVQW